MSMSDVENHKADALCVLRDFSQTRLDSLEQDDRQTLLEAVLGVPASSRQKLRNGTPPSKKKRGRRPKAEAGEDDEEVVTPLDVRRKLLDGSAAAAADDDVDYVEPEKECPGAPIANRRRMRIPQHVRALFQDD